jgi:hypothetical protein
MTVLQYEIYGADASFMVFTAVMFEVEVIWVVTLYSVVVGYRRFGGQCYPPRSFEDFTAVVIQGEVIWVVTPCSVVVGYRRVEGPCCLTSP